MWLKIAQIAFGVLISAAQRITPEQWAQLGSVIVQWLQKIQVKLPASHPLRMKLSAFDDSHAGK